MSKSEFGDDLNTFEFFCCRVKTFCERMCKREGANVCVFTRMYER